jgi:hypothetical protein
MCILLTVDYDCWLIHTQDRPTLSSDRAPSHGQDSNCQTVNKYLVLSPRRGSTPRQTEWLTVSRNVTLTWLWDLSTCCNYSVHCFISAVKHMILHTYTLLLFIFITSSFKAHCTTWLNILKRISWQRVYVSVPYVCSYSQWLFPYAVTTDCFLLRAMLCFLTSEKDWIFKYYLIKFYV